MKFKTRPVNIFLIAALATSMISPVVLAGSGYQAEVVVGSTYAAGAKFAARLSNDTQQYIGCTNSTTGSANYDYMSCFARNKSGATFYCYATGSSAANFISALDTVNDASYLSIEKNSDGTCKVLRVNNSSLYL